jgi:hypothetical protein
MNARPQPRRRDALSRQIEALTPLVLEDRQAGVRNGPVEQWRDALAVDWLRKRLQTQPWGQR